MERADDHHEEIVAFVRRLQEAGIYDSQFPISRYTRSDMERLNARQRLQIPPWQQQQQQQQQQSLNDANDTYVYTDYETQLIRQRIERRTRWLDRLDELHAEPHSGVSQATINRLRSYQMAAGRKDNIITCSICLANVQIAERVRVLSCEHEFHAQCVDKWLLEKPTCPMCRSTVQ